MNDSITQQLERLVERTVRPVRAPSARKKRMREDLFSHLCTTFEDEFSKSRDESAALSTTCDRFGNPSELSSELQQSVSLRQHISYWLERAYAQQPGESLFQLSCRNLAASVCLAGCLTLLGLSLLSDHLSDGHPRPVTLIWVFAVVTMAASCTGSLLQWLSDRMGRAMLNPDPQASSRLKSWYGLLSLTLFPGILILNYAGLSHAPGIESFSPTAEVYLFASILAPLGLLLVSFIGPKLAAHRLYEEKWADLELPVG